MHTHLNAHNLSRDEATRLDTSDGTGDRNGTYKGIPLMVQMGEKRIQYTVNPEDRYVNRDDCKS